ncbi:lipopolysaccharide biosynthesis protein [Thermophilibacter immobilis]|uniref:Lipopolysaccharide biosynthesis protein n=1 Tax=Thermophilibacter immobilis TaxID=2779519 RepID=A0A7S7RV88_9ACTN|nr:lipopolysaccharide biosynthesis protein [Thermophilibacter immobilis]QOY61383.1 lipopolysaccharide biosynthesis protein [Thermophilibacter immobilis]
MGDEKKESLSIRQNMLWNSVGSLSNLVCQWAITVLIVRLSTTYDSAGIYSLAMSVYGIFAPLAQYRTYTYQISDVRGEHTVGEYLAFRLITCLGALVLTMGYAVATCRPNALPAILLYALYKLSGLVIDVFHASDQQFHRMDYIGKSLFAQGVSSLAVFILAYPLTQSLEATIFLMMVTTVLIGVFYDYPRTNLLVPVTLGITKKRAARLLVRCAPIVIAGVAASAAPSLPRQYLSTSMGDSALGIYASVAAPVAIIQMGASYIYNPLLGYLSEAYDKRDRAQFMRLLITTLGGIATVALVCALGLEFLGAPLLRLVYGESIVGYVYLLQPLVLCAAITGIMWFSNDLLISLRNFRCTFVGSLIALVVSLLVMAPSVGAWGMNGVTLTNALSCIAGTVFMMVCLLIQLKGHFVTSEKRSSDGGEAK